MEKRYAIVKVDRDNEDFKCPTCPSVAQSCCDCKIVETYGDTKEQLIRKVAQVLYREELEWYKTHLKFVPGSEIDEPFFRNIYENCLVKAKEIVEFLGVK